MSNQPKWSEKNPPYLPNQVWLEARSVCKFRLCNVAPKVPVDYWDRMLDNWEDPKVVDALIEIAIELAKERYGLPVVSMRHWIHIQNQAQFCEHMGRFPATTLRYLGVPSNIVTWCAAA